MANRSLRRVLLAALVPALVGSACAAPEPGAARGEQVWDTCAPCHGETGQGNQTLGAPAIAGLPAWYVTAQLGKFEAGLRGAHPEDLVGIRMKSMARALDREGDRESVAAYVATLPQAAPPPTLTEGDATRGQEAYGRLCVSCHQPDGSGLEALQAAPLAHQHDWYLLAQMQKFWDGWRGANPAGDAFGGIMAGIAQTQVDRATALDIIAYLRTLP